MRRRRIKDLDVPFFLDETREGSFEFIFEYPEHAVYLAGFVGNAIAGGITWDLIKRVFNSATGVETGDDVGDENFSLNGGDFGALVQATESAIRRAHNVINHGSANINIFVSGGENTITLDRQTKEYMHENIFNDEIRTQRFLVTSFDGRNRSGRVFDLEAEQAFTFELMSAADRESLVTIVDAARSYALRQKGQFDQNMEIVARFSSVDAPDGRLKKLRVFAARKDFDEIDSEDYDSLIE